MKIFPFNMYAHDHGNYVTSPELAQAVWMRLRDGRSWYATDCEVTGESSITLRVYCMADSFYGGIGKMVHEMEVKEFTKGEKAFLTKAIAEHATWLARKEFIRIQEEKENAEILELRKKLFNI